ncbi:MAG: response regulator transcription factor [Aquabacterium sp.]|nr:MAG: response regulator transcription factor [Aquabacterium sp.]
MSTQARDPGNPTALIAEDEPVLAQALATQLTRLWPALRLLPPARNGIEACARAAADRPDLLFLDIRMPGRSGLEAAEAIVEDWPGHLPLPLLVFVTAYDDYAVPAFERAAVDYVLKPAQPERLALTVERLRERLRQRELDEQVALAPLLAWQAFDGDEAAPQAGNLSVLQAEAAGSLYLIPVDEVACLEAADKYVRLLPMQPQRYPGEILLRTPLRQLAQRLAPERFWQIHRGTVVNITAVERVSRDGARLRVHLRGLPQVLDVSRMYAHRFKAM